VSTREVAQNPETEVAKPPITGNAHVLPFDRLDPLTFERLCLWLVEAEGYADAAHYGLAGSDDGRDIVALKTRGNRSEVWYFQCKRRKRLETSDLTDTVEAITALKDLPKKPIGLVFITTCAVSAQMRDAVEKHAKQRRLRIHIWAGTELDRKAKRHADLLNEFFGFGSRRGEPAHLALGIQPQPPTPGSIPEPGPLPTCRMRLRHNPSFVGRRTELLALSQLLYTRGICFLVTGIGGVGKTQLACSFVHRFGRYFTDGVFWINCADPEGIAEQVAECGSSLGIGGTIEEKVERVRAIWNSSGARLLVFDNCDDAALFDQWRPASNASSVLCTSRSIRWNSNSGVEVLFLGTLDRASSVELLSKLSPSHATNVDGFHALADELGDLPLALHLAGCFLERYRAAYSVRTLLNELRQPSLLEHQSLRGHRQELYESPTHHELCIARTFAVSVERLQTDDAIDRLSLQLLGCASHLAPGVQIPTGLLAAIAAIDTSIATEAVRLEDAIERLGSVGLIEREHSNVRLHRLLAAYARGVAEPSVLLSVETCLAGTVELWNEVGILTILNEISEHLRRVVVLSASRTDVLSARLAHGFGFYLAKMGNLPEACRHLRRAHEGFVALEGEDSPNAGYASNSLAMSLRVMGEVETAAQLQERNMARAVLELGPNSPELASRLNNLAMPLIDLGRLEEAKALLIRAKELLVSETDPIAEASIENNLGLLHSRQGAQDLALESLERALSIRLTALGDHHPDVALSHFNLGCVMEQLGQYTEAARHLETAYRLYCEVFDKEHPDAVRALGHLANAYWMCSDLERAATSFQEGIRIYSLHGEASVVHAIHLLVGLSAVEERRGALDEAEIHLIRAVGLAEGNCNMQALTTCLHALADLYLKKGNIARVREVLEKFASHVSDLPEGERLGALAHISVKRAMLEVASGRDHVARDQFAVALDAAIRAYGETSIPVALCLAQMATASERAGDFVTAHSALLRVVHIREALRALNEADGAAVLLRLGSLLLSMGDLDAAEHQLRRALQLQEKLHGKRDPILSETLCALANVAAAEEKPLDARQLFRRALSILERVDRSEQNHDGIIACLAGVGRIERQLGNLNAAQAAQEKALSLSVSTFGLQNRRTALCLSNLSVVAFARGEPANALDLVRQSIAIYEATLGPGHSETRSAHQTLRAILASR